MKRRLSLVAAAHARGLRLIFDAVPNHVFADHPAYQVHSRRAVGIAALPTQKADAQSWFHDGDRACICGAPGCGWGERIEDCWFDRYLPDLNLRHPDARQAGVEDPLWWLDRFDLDGMRIDAVPMMPRPATRSMVKAVREQRLRAGWTCWSRRELHRTRRGRTGQHPQLPRAPLRRAG